MLLASYHAEQSPSRGLHQQPICKDLFFFSIVFLFLELISLSYLKFILLLFTIYPHCLEWEQSLQKRYCDLRASSHPLLQCQYREKNTFLFQCLSIAVAQVTLFRPLSYPHTICSLIFFFPPLIFFPHLFFSQEGILTASLVLFEQCTCCWEWRNKEML